MSVTRSKTDLIRMSWITELRRQGDRKCEGAYHMDGKVCALGMLLEVVNTGSSPLERWNCSGDWVERATGLSYRQACQVVGLNDGSSLAGIPKHTFAEIADVVASWFPQT